MSKKGLWDNIWAKRRRIASGSGERMRKPGEKGAPTKAALKASQVVKETIREAIYQGKEVPLNKPMKGDVKKSKVYVDPDGDGKAQKVNFGDPNMEIKSDNPKNKASYCARSAGIKNTKNIAKANYWSRKAWKC